MIDLSQIGIDVDRHFGVLYPVLNRSHYLFGYLVRPDERQCVVHHDVELDEFDRARIPGLELVIAPDARIEPHDNVLDLAHYVRRELFIHQYID